MASGTIIVTGANGGLGSAIVSQLVRSSDYSSLHGVYAVRDPAAASTLNSILEAEEEGDRQDDVLRLDLSKLSSVRAFAADINKRVASGQLPPLRALVLNAGFQEQFTLTKTEDGLDMTFQVNHLANFLLTLLLLQSMDKRKGRILVLGSWTHDPTDPRFNGAAVFPPEYRPILAGGVGPFARGEWSTPDDDPSGLAGIRRYGASKLCQIIMMLELQRRLHRDPEISGISVLGLDPAAMPSGIMRHGSFFQRVILNQVAGNALAPAMTWIWPNGQLRTPAKSATDVLRAVLDEETLGTQPKGLYLNGSEEASVSEEAKDPETGKRLWSESAALAGITNGETVLAGWR